MNLLDLPDDLLKKIFCYTEIGDEIRENHHIKMRKNLFINKSLFQINLKLFCDINKKQRKLLRKAKIKKTFSLEDTKN